jgi:exonuclease-1
MNESFRSVSEKNNRTFQIVENMGIQGLLKELEPCLSDRYLSELQGLRVAVDGYVWLHRGVFFCAADIAKGKPCQSYVKYFMNRVQQLLRYDADPYFPPIYRQA